jgi:hypothetical protein
MGVGRCVCALSQLYKRPCQVLMAHQERLIDEFPW